MMQKRQIYLDHNATTQLRPEAMAAISSVLSETGNASSPHAHGRQARKHIETARKVLADCLDVSSGQVFFNSGATEGNNTILKGYYQTQPDKKILVGATEHASVVDCGIPSEKIRVLPSGLIDLDDLAEKVKNSPCSLVSVMLVNNETGIIQPVSDIAKLVHDHGAKFHCDAVQAFGRIDIKREVIGADFITLSAHKIGGPQGVGALIVAPNSTVPKLLEGGGQERRSRAGTENVAGIAGFGAAASAAYKNISSFQTLLILREQIEDCLRLSNHTEIIGLGADRVTNTISCIIDGVKSETLLMAFDIEGISLSSGSACSSGTVKFSHVLKAMGYEEIPDRAALRISLGWTSTQNDVDEFITVWNNLRTRLLKE
jgi:cysteine desulfurase